MAGSVRGRMLAGLAVAVLLAGGVLAAVTVATPASKPRRPHAHTGGRAAGASAYLGVDPETLRRRIETGRSPARVAEATRGKSAADLVQSLLARQAAAQQARGPHKRASARVTAQDERFGPLAPPASISAQYLGLSLRELRTRLGAGTSLGRIADSVPGRSRRGLIDALMAPRLARLGPLIAAGRLTPAQQSRRALLIEAVVIVTVDRVHPKVARRQAAQRRAHALRVRRAHALRAARLRSLSG